MKRFILVAAALIFAGFLWHTAYYRFGLYVDLHPDAPVESLLTVEEKEICIRTEEGEEPFEIRGVDLGSGMPGEWSTDYAIDKETYLRWFAQIQKMGANTIRVYTLQGEDFYNAFYEYNENREEPLYLIHGVWVNDYIQDSHRDAYDEEFRQTFLNDCRTLVDVLHGNRVVSLGYGVGSGSYQKDVSPWVIGYILGAEWEDTTVEYTNKKYPERDSYTGEYLYTTSGATPFEAMLCEVGDYLMEYETRRYHEQRLISFFNWPGTDPFIYPGLITQHFQKCAQVNVEHIRTTENVCSGQFASYQVYPYAASYLEYLDEAKELLSGELTDEELLERIRAQLESKGELEETTEEEIQVIFENEKEELAIRRQAVARTEERNARKEAPDVVECLAAAEPEEGREDNLYYTYIRLLNDYHTMPVVISEFGLPSSRGMAQKDHATNRNQGFLSEEEQAEGLVSCWQDIKAAGCAGGMVSSWQDEWYRRTWNTMHAVDLDNTAYWSDYQSSDQSLGILTFDPGEKESVCYVDGEVSEWKEADLVSEREGMSLSMKYDEKFLYFRIHKDDLNEEDVLYIPLDITPKSGSTYCQETKTSFERGADFLMVIDGKENSRVLVQERYDVLRAMYSQEVYATDAYLNPVDKNSPVFHPVRLILQTSAVFTEGDFNALAETYETGKLRHGNASPKAEEYDSLADFIISGDEIEIRLPWQLLNFSNPSEMQVHDDYYECYGVENLSIEQLYAGIGEETKQEGRIPMESFDLEGWGKEVTFHERLKQAYYALQDLWTKDGAGGENSNVGK